ATRVRKNLVRSGCQPKEIDIAHRLAKFDLRLAPDGDQAESLHALQRSRMGGEYDPSPGSDQSLDDCTEPSSIGEVFLAVKSQDVIIAAGRLDVVLLQRQ